MLAVEEWALKYAGVERDPPRRLIRRARNKFYASQRPTGHGCLDLPLTYAMVPALRAEPELCRRSEICYGLQSVIPHDFGLRSLPGSGLIAAISR